MLDPGSAAVGHALGLEDAAIAAFMSSAVLSWRTCCSSNSACAASPPISHSTTSPITPAGMKISHNRRLRRNSVFIYHICAIEWQWST